jgi:PKHD-type hydroxylase
VPRIFDADECAWLTASIAEFGQSPGLIGHGDGPAIVDPEIRRASQTRLRRGAETAWAYERVAAAVERCNREHFGFDLSGYAADMVLVEYRRGDFFNWHVDLGPGSASRKLAVTVTLSKPEDFGGGALCFAPSMPALASIDQGAGVAFPSFLLHGVQPVTHGRRRVLVAWFAGPPFR